MRFFLDENFPKKARIFLENNGHQVFGIRSTPDEGADDFDIFGFAQEKKAVFLTTDRDFYHTVPFFFQEHYGVIVIALRQPNGPKILEKLIWFIEKKPISNFSSQVILLKDNHFTVSKKGKILDD